MPAAIEERADETTDTEEMKTKEAQEAEAKLIRQIEAEHSFAREEPAPAQALQQPGP